MFRLSTRRALRSSRPCVTRSSTRPTLRDDERTLSISANGAYYLIRARLREIGAALLGVHSGTGVA